MSLKHKTETAFGQVLVNAGVAVWGKDHPEAEEADPQVRVYRSQENSATPRILPCVSIETFGGPERPLRTGNFHLKVVVQIRGTADKQSADEAPPPEDRHAAAVKAIIQALNKRELAASLSDAVADFHCFGVVRMGPIHAEPEDRSFVEAHMYEVTVCESDINP